MLESTFTIDARVRRDDTTNRSGNVKRVYQIARILSRKGKGRSSNAQSELDAMSYEDGVCEFNKSAMRELEGASDGAL